MGFVPGSTQILSVLAPMCAYCKILRWWVLFLRLLETSKVFIISSVITSGLKSRRNYFLNLDNFSATRSFVDFDGSLAMVGFSCLGSSAVYPSTLLTLFLSFTLAFKTVAIKYSIYSYFFGSLIIIEIHRPAFLLQRLAHIGFPSWSFFCWRWQWWLWSIIANFDLATYEGYLKHNFVWLYKTPTEIPCKQEKTENRKKCKKVLHFHYRLT